MKGPFFKKNEIGGFGLVEDCEECAFCDGSDDYCILFDCPFHFTKIEESEEDDK